MCREFQSRYIRFSCRSHKLLTFRKKSNIYVSGQTVTVVLKKKDKSVATVQTFGDL